MATTFSYARERIYECLVDGSGTSHALSAAQRFKRGMPPGTDPKLRSKEARSTPRVFVTLRGMESDPFASGENNTTHIYLVTVHLWRDYWLGANQDVSTQDSQLERSWDDFPRVRAVLCQPGNLTQTEGGNATGFASESLDGSSARTELQRETSLGGSDRLLTYLDTFTAAFEFEPA